jgi:hypothetical protein
MLTYCKTTRLNFTTKGFFGPLLAFNSSWSTAQNKAEAIDLGRFSWCGTQKFGLRRQVCGYLFPKGRIEAELRKK